MNRRQILTSIGAISVGCLVPRYAATAQNQGIPPAFVELGVQEDGHWVSPHFGVEVEWDRPFALDYGRSQSVYRDTNGEMINLDIPDMDGNFHIWMSYPTGTIYKPFEESESRVKDYEKFLDPTFLLFKANEEVAAGLLLMELGVSVLDGKDQPNAIFLLQEFPAKHDPAVVVQTRLDARYDSIEQYIEALDTSVEVDGGPALRAFTKEEILEALEDLPPDG